MTALAVRIISAVTVAIVAVVVLGILLVVLEANRGNGIVDFLLNVAEFFAAPFDSIFDLDDDKLQVAINYGIAAVVYGVVGALLARGAAFIGGRRAAA